MISCYLGVTEPAMFGINLKICLSICCGHDWFSNGRNVLPLLMGVRATSIGVGGLPGIFIYCATILLAVFLVAMVIAIIVPMGLTYIFRKKGIFNKSRSS